MSDESSSNQRKNDVAMLDKHVEQLMEHFDSVQILATRHMPAEHDGTICVNRGSGNWQARFGQMREWVIYEEQRIRCAANRNESTND